MQLVSSQRMHELGVRIALGARSGDVVRLVVFQGLRPVCAAVGIGLAIVLMVHRNKGTSDIDRLRDTAEPPQPWGTAPEDGETTDEPPTGEKAEATA